jgi:drug/metabolite transporter (DMT)-like permease
VSLNTDLFWTTTQGFVVTGVSFYLQAWCIEKRGPVFLAMSNPLGLLLTIFCSSFFLGDVVHLGSLLGGGLLVGGLYSVLWGKSKDQAVTNNGDDEEINNKQQQQQKEEVKELEASSSPVPHQV